VSFTAPSVDNTETIVLSETVTDQYGNQATTTVDVTITDVPVSIIEEPPKKDSSSSGGSFGFSILAFISLLLLRDRAFVKRK
jgi:hypothetical protein